MYYSELYYFIEQIKVLFCVIKIKNRSVLKIYLYYYMKDDSLSFFYVLSYFINKWNVKECKRRYNIVFLRTIVFLQQYNDMVVNLCYNTY